MYYLCDFSHCCDSVAEKKNLGKDAFGSQFVDTVCHGREVLATGIEAAGHTARIVR